VVVVRVTSENIKQQDSCLYRGSGPVGAIPRFLHACVCKTRSILIITHVKKR